jgi:hypothetical protein
MACELTVYGTRKTYSITKSHHQPQRVSALGIQMLRLYRSEPGRCDTELHLLLVLMGRAVHFVERCNTWL